MKGQVGFGNREIRIWAARRGMLGAQRGTGPTGYHPACCRPAGALPKHGGYHG